MQNFSVQSVIFDLDGTLIDTAGDLHASTNHALSIIGRDAVPLDAVKADVGYGALRLIECGLERTGGCDGIDMEALKQEFLLYYAENIAVNSSLFPGGLSMLTALQSRGIQMAICTNKPQKLAIKLLEDLNLTHFFVAITGGDSFPFKKPDPRHILETIKLLGTNSVLMVGDASPDILGAKAAGIPVAAAAYGYADVDLHSLNPDVIIQTLGEVEGLVSG